MTNAMTTRLSRLERAFFPVTRAPVSIHIVASDEEEAVARRAIQAEGTGPNDDRIRIIRLTAPEVSP